MLNVSSRRCTNGTLLAFAFVLLAALPVPAQKDKKKPEAASTSAVTPVKAEPPKLDDLLKGLKYREIGPFRGGRSLTAAGVPSDPNTYYFGSTGGGVWKSTDGAMTWQPVFDDQGTSSIGSVAVAASDPNVVYVGTGEAVSVAIFPTATASTKASTAARLGRTPASKTRAPSAASSSPQES